MPGHGGSGLSSMSDTDHDTYKNKIFRAFGRGNDPSEVERYFAYKVHRCTQSREKQRPSPLPAKTTEPLEERIHGWGPQKHGRAAQSGSDIRPMKHCTLRASGLIKFPYSIFRPLCGVKGHLPNDKPLIVRNDINPETDSQWCRISARRPVDARNNLPSGNIHPIACVQPSATQNLKMRSVRPPLETGWVGRHRPERLARFSQP